MLPSQTAAYHPEELSLLGQVLDSAVEALPPSLRTASNRMAMARNIFKLAATGVRDPFELQLAAWTEDESAWPATRDLKTFREWFRIDVHSVVVDVPDDEIEGEEI